MQKGDGHGHQSESNSKLKGRKDNDHASSREESRTGEESGRPARKHMRGLDRNRNLSLSKGKLGEEGLAELLFDATGGGAGATISKIRYLDFQLF